MYFVPVFSESWAAMRNPSRSNAIYKSYFSSLTAEINLFPETKSNIPLIENVILNFGNLNDDNWYYESPNIEFTGFCALIAEATII